MSKNHRHHGQKATLVEVAYRISEDYSLPTFAFGEVLKIDIEAMRGQRFLVDGIRFWSSRSAYSMLDYILVRIPRMNPLRPVRLRMMPSRSTGKGERKLVALSLYDASPFNEGLLSVVRDTTEKFVISDDSDSTKVVHEEFLRVNATEACQTCKVTAIEASAPEIGPESISIEYWDYSRLIEADGIGIEEFIFVEMNTENGWFEIWRGLEVTADQISPF